MKTDVRRSTCTKADYAFVLVDLTEDFDRASLALNPLVLELRAEISLHGYEV